MTEPTELTLPNDCPEDLYERIKNYVGSEWNEEEKHFFYIDNLRPNSPSILVFEKWNYPLKPTSYKDLNLTSPTLKIPTLALKQL